MASPLDSIALLLRRDGHVFNSHLFTYNIMDSAIVLSLSGKAHRKAHRTKPDCSRFKTDKKGSRIETTPCDGSVLFLQVCVWGSEASTEIHVMV